MAEPVAYSHYQITLVLVLSAGKVRIVRKEIIALIVLVVRTENVYLQDTLTDVIAMMASMVPTVKLT